MTEARLARIILYVENVERLSEFYRQAFAFELGQDIPGEWAVLDAGGCEIGLLKSGAAYRAPPGGWSGDNNNAKIVFSISEPIEEARARLVALGVEMGEIKNPIPASPARCATAAIPKATSFSSRRPERAHRIWCRA